MTLRELLRLSAERAAVRVGESLTAVTHRYRRYQLLNRISTLYRDREHFDVAVREGLEAMRLLDLEIAKTESEFRRLK